MCARPASASRLPRGRRLRSVQERPAAAPCRAGLQRDFAGASRGCAARAGARVARRQAGDRRADRDRVRRPRARACSSRPACARPRRSPPPTRRPSRRCSRGTSARGTPRARPQRDPARGRAHPQERARDPGRAPARAAGRGGGRRGRARQRCGGHAGRRRRIARWRQRAVGRVGGAAVAGPAAAGDSAPPRPRPWIRVSVSVRVGAQRRRLLPAARLGGEAHELPAGHASRQPASALWGQKGRERPPPATSTCVRWSRVRCSAAMSAEQCGCAVTVTTGTARPAYCRPCESSRRPGLVRVMAPVARARARTRRLRAGPQRAAPAHGRAWCWSRARRWRASARPGPRSRAGRLRWTTPS